MLNNLDDVIAQNNLPLELHTFFKEIMELETQKVKASTRKKNSQFNSLNNHVCLIAL